MTIRGPKEDVEKASKMLTEMSTERQLNSSSATIRAKPEHHKFLIGRQGANIQQVRDQTGARIIFPNEKDDDREVITILGEEIKMILGVISKGQLNSEWIYEVIVSPKMPTKKFPDFCPTLSEQKSGNILVGILGETMTS